jgi:hypothetical protein
MEGLTGVPQFSVPLGTEADNKGPILKFVALSFAMFLTLSFTQAYTKREEIKANWSKYHDDLLYIFAAPMFKPDDDPRSRVQFATDNFNEVMGEKVKAIFATLLSPIFTIFKLFTDALNQTLGGIFNVRALMGNMWKKWVEVMDMFNARFNGTVHELRMVYVKLQSSFQRIFAVATSSVYQAMSLINSITSFFDLMITVCIAILVVLVVMVVLLFFVLWPMIPLILVAIGIISAAGFGGAVGGMSEAFCFAAGTRVATVDGWKPIETIGLDTKLADGESVLGVITLGSSIYKMYDLYGVHVSGSHIVFHNGTPIHVEDHPDALPVWPSAQPVYCLITSNQKIQVLSVAGPLVFADWEELSSEDTDSLLRWNRQVYIMLNNAVPYASVSETNYLSEAGVSGTTHVMTPVGLCEIRGIRPGDSVLDSTGKFTRVCGLVKLQGSTARGMYTINNNAAISAGAWIRLHPDAEWDQLSPNSDHSEPQLYNLFTESGSFRICEQAFIDMRDFSDIGIDKIHESYEWVLQSVKFA